MYKASVSYQTADEAPSGIDLDLLLRYSDPKYTHVVFLQNGLRFWTLEESEEAAKHRVTVETEGYGNLPEWQFTYLPITRREMTMEDGHKVPIVEPDWSAGS